jgi:hypothetical protein
MTSICKYLVLAALALLTSVSTYAQNLPCNVMSLGIGANLNGFIPFPSDNLWNQNIFQAPVDPNSSNIINFIGPTVNLHPDFGAGLYAGQTIGIPYIVVADSIARVNIHFTAYGSESDPGPMPVPANAPIEGRPHPDHGDRHVLVLDQGNCWLYEMDNSHKRLDGSWNANSAAVWDLLSDEQRPYTWTSADAAGLPIFPGLVRYDEVAAGQILHALRFTLQNSIQAFTPPASHWAPNSTNQYAAPMGMRVRLKASFDISGFSPANQVILTALKQYGMIMADNGSSMFLSGTPDNRWNNNDLDHLKTLTASDFEVVLINPLYTPLNVPQGPSPTIASFSCGSQCTVSSGTPVTLTWNVSNALYYIVSPQVGAIRGTSVVVTPTVTTNYTLYATNQYGRTKATATVTVE